MWLANPFFGNKDSEHLQWHQGFLGEWAKATLPAQYGVDGIPSIFLIDPSGKIAATDLRGDEIAAAVGRTLDHGRDDGRENGRAI